MFFFNINTTLAIVTILLSLEGFFSTDASSSRTSKSQPIKYSTDMIMALFGPSSSRAARTGSSKWSPTLIMAITACVNEINDVFHEQTTLRDYITHAINEFRRDVIGPDKERTPMFYVLESSKQLENYPKLDGYALIFYNTLHRYAFPGQLKSIVDFCKNEDDENDCKEVLQKLFGSAGEPKTVLFNAIYAVNRHMVISEDNDVATRYFDEILRTFIDNSKPENEDPYLGPLDFCESKISSEQLNLNLGLNL